MVATVRTVAFQGIEAIPVEVQVQIAPGLPAFTVVGLPDKAVGESRERVRAAILSMGLALPSKRIVVNLAPADLAKEGSHFDLPIALGLLIAIGVIPADAVSEYNALGELSLDGRLLPVSGVLPASVAASAAGRGVICPCSGGAEARWAGDIPILAADSLNALVNHFHGTQVLSPPEPGQAEEAPPMTDMADIRGQYAARRALEIAAAGGHNLLMSGPPGAGKSLLASCLPGILPPLSTREILDVSMIYSVAGMLAEGKLSRLRPFRAPHHSTSMAAMVGGGMRAKPGEISLAHRGVLFLDELPEFARPVLESLRQPLESGTVTIARANAHLTYPARFQLIAAMNPCKCGYLGDEQRACNKAPRCASDYQSRLSGPLLDRIDLHIDVPMMETLDMMRRDKGEPSTAVAARVGMARRMQEERAVRLGLPDSLNATVSGDNLAQIVVLGQDGERLLEDAARRFRLSMRAFTRLQRVARTIADLEGSASVKTDHLAEALAYRQMQHGFQVEAA